MSTPKNPLDVFRSYAYHHILIACDGTETAEKLATVSEITAFDHEGAEAKFCPRKVTGGSGQYIVLINGMSDAQFTITDAKWTSVLIPNNKQGEGDASTTIRTMAVDGEINIQEPLGVNFLNLLNDVTKSLGTDPNGVVFMLKTIFVGHHHAGRTEYITNIRPLLFLAYDITSLFDVTGAEYTLSFVGISNGAAQLPHNSAITNGFHFTVPSGKKMLSEVMAKLGTELTAHYARQKAELIKQAQKIKLDYNIEDEFIDVEYVIILHPEYYDKKAGTAAIKTSTDTGDDDTIITGDSLSVESVISAIMKSSKSVMDEDQKSAAAGERYQFRITSTLETSPDKYKIIYQVQRWKATVVPVENLFTFEPPKNKDGTPGGIEFDYIFSGQNVDVLSFDLKMQMGMAFFQTLAVESSIPSGASQVIKHYNPSSKVAGTGNKNGTGDQSEFGGGCENSAVNSKKRRKKPLFLGMSVDDSSVRNKRFPSTVANYDAILQRHAAFENIEARMIIRGNPQLLEDTTHYASNLDPTGPSFTPIVRTGQDDARNIVPNLQSQPGFVKVNVMMPNSSQVGPAGQMYSQDFSRNFWYPGWYFLYSVNHTFSDGEFTQELEMYSLPTDASQHKVSENVDETKANPDTTDFPGQQNAGVQTDALTVSVKQNK